MSCGQFPEIQKKNWLNQMPELGIIAETEFVEVFNKPSSDVLPESWLLLAQAILKKLDKADGFVVLHNIDNILYTASALSLLLNNLTKPIIFTGRQLTSEQTDFKASIINAVQAAGNDFSEVCLMFGNRLLRASQSTRILSGTLNIFEAPADSVIGRIDFSIRVFDKLISRNKGKAKLAGGFNNNIATINLSPLIDLPTLTKDLADKNGVLVQAKYYESIPEDLMFILQKVATDIPVIIWSEKINVNSLTPKNMLIVNNMIWEMTAVKLSWILSQTQDIKKIKELMVKNISGEIIS